MRRTFCSFPTSSRLEAGTLDPAHPQSGDHEYSVHHQLHSSSSCAQTPVLLVVRGAIEIKSTDLVSLSRLNNSPEVCSM